MVQLLRLQVGASLFTKAWSIHSGGINSLWPLFGIGNQILAAMALDFGYSDSVQNEKEKYVWVTIIPTLFLFITSMTAGWQKIFHENPKIGFLAQADRFNAAIAKNELLAPAKTSG